MRGAVRALWGRAHETLLRAQGWPTATASIALGPTLAMWRRRRGRALERRWPVPGDVEYVRSSDQTPAHVRYLRPAPSAIATLGRDDDPARERLWIAPALDRGLDHARHQAELSVAEQRLGARDLERVRQVGRQHGAQPQQRAQIAAVAEAQRARTGRVGLGAHALILSTFRLSAYLAFGFSDSATFEQSISMTYMVTLKLDEADKARKLAASGAKVQIGKAGKLISQDAVQIHGGMGMTDELNVGHFFKRVTMIETQFGNTDWHLRRYTELSNG